MGRKLALAVGIGVAVLSVAGIARAQNFGSLIVNRKKIVLLRKLPPTGRVEGTTFKVTVDAKGFQADVATDMKSTLESLLIRDDPRLRSEEGAADTVISCRITNFSQPAPQTTAQPPLPGSKPGTQAQSMTRITGMLTVSFQARSRAGSSLAADNVTAKFDQEYTTASAQMAMLHSMAHTMTHLTKGGEDDDNPPTPAELHNRLIEDVAHQIAAHLVNTTEQVEVYLAKGSGLDQADKLMEEKLWSRALEQLETMKPFPTPEEDAYRLYDLGVVNEAMAYSAEDLQKARKDLQDASVDYGKAIDAKPTEKYFLQPQTRIDTALAHYKVLGDQKAPASTSASVPASRSVTTSSPASAPSSDVLTNEQVISMAMAGMDEGNIIDTIKHAKSVNFDLSVQGQVDLSKNKVTGTVISAMKTRARAAPVHHVATSSGKTGS